MVIHYTEEGNIRIELVTLEDRIIWKNLFKSREESVVFERTGCGDVYEAKPPRTEPFEIDLTANLRLDSRVSYRQLQEFKADNAKLGAVKYIKEATGWDLRTSKEYLDERWDRIVPFYQ